jgi:hypothetical protein
VRICAAEVTVIGTWEMHLMQHFGI